MDGQAHKQSQYNMITRDVSEGLLAVAGTAEGSYHIPLTWQLSLFRNTGGTNGPGLEFTCENTSNPHHNSQG